MMQVTIVGLLGASLYLASRWLGARAQVAELQRKVTALKRQLGQRR
jgi:hypothetical protein